MARGGERRVVVTGDGATWEENNEKNDIPYCGENNQTVLK